MADIGPEVCRRSVFHSLDLPPVVPGIVTSRSSQWGENLSRKTVFVIMYKIKGFREKLVCIVSTFLIFMFVDQLDVFSQLYYLTYTSKLQ